MTSARKWEKGLLLVLLATAALAGAGCRGHGGGASKPDGGGHDAETCSNDAGAHQENGAACRCAADCASGFCVDGLCCNTACTEGCKSCNTVSAPGVCSFVAAGDPPRSAAVCPANTPASCGLDGTCDGKGGCRNYQVDTVCQPGVCSGAAVVGARVCDGSGNCTAAAATICLPYGCDTKSNSCSSSCASDTDCGPNVKCVNGSCGLKRIGAACTASSECASTFCADGVCCNTTCSRACVSCAEAGHIGTCEPTGRGELDPHNVCAASDKASCGQTGACDGVGGCAKYAAETVCISPTCSGNRVNTAGTCDGLGTCRAPGVQDCGTYQCAAGACINHCTTNADCVTGHSCVNGSCGPKSNGQPCSAGSECASTFCADGVCCNSACAGSCQTCALSTSLGTCASSPAGATDPHGFCTDRLAASCGTDGTCDGSGGCRKYPSGTVCAAETCTAAGIYTPASTCDANGKCSAPDSIGCAPYLCNGPRCYQSCTDNTSCSAGNVCTSGSCGPKPNGAFCSAGSECRSQNCAQGVCCATACADACRSCAITGSMGLCTAVSAGPDPAGVCVDSGVKACGTDGKCQAGVCERYAQGTSCASATCPAAGTTFTPPSTCDGAGTCDTPLSTSCFPYACGATACKATCATDADCAMPASCMSGSCGLKPNGAVCSSGTECTSTICAQGICCATSCTGTCLSCAVSGMAGTCAPVAAGGADPGGHCTDQGAASCGTTGTCNGSGACALYVAGTQCVGASCPSGTATENLPRSCDGNGVCKPVSTQSCAPFACNATTGTTCVAVCSTNADCAPGNVCNAGACGLKRAGQTCAAGSECATGNCVDGVCCSSASCGTCQACNLTNNAGTCQPVAAGSTEPHGGCATDGACGNNGTCDGNGLCAKAAIGTSCGTASCTGATATPVGACDGAGACVQSQTTCGAYVCGTGAACLTACAANSDCIAGDTCQSGSCTNLLPLGSACTSGAQCLSTSCTDGVCCSSSACGRCRSCALASSLGTCANVGLVADPAHVCVDQGAGSCGTTGLCDGAGQCALYASGISCAAATCQKGTPALHGAASCDGAGHCKPASTTDCTPFACVGGACNTTCTVSSDCATGYTCAAGADGGSPTCVAAS